MAAGGWVGFALGLTLGAMIGGVVVWFAGAVLDWQRDLAFTLGVARSLLPFGDQAGLLRWVGSTWYLVIPAIGLAGGLAAAILGALVGGLLAAAYNRSPRRALIVVELPEEASHPPAESVLDSAPHGEDREE